jgi:5-formyltetrahydrofolate cyclo-ligase
VPTPDGHVDGDATAALRRSARHARRSLDDRARAAAEDLICDGLVSLEELSHPGRVGWYLATDGEVDLAAAARQLRSLGTELWLPVVGASRSMTFAAWAPGTALEPNRFGIAEPVHSPHDLVEAGALDAVVVPCVAVDPQGHRVGFGAGYYDRALAGASRTARIGVAFEVQVVDQLQPAPWDVPLDVVVSEARIIRPDANDPG